MKIAVIVHVKKRLGHDDVGDLRLALTDAGVTDPLWFDVNKSKKAPKAAAKAAKKGAELVLVWGGDGTVRRCIDALSEHDIPVGILPAGTANLLASSLQIPIELPGALEVALHGDRRTLDVGVVNGERFAVMTGTGFDALMIRDADALKDRFGRVSYVWSGLKAMWTDRVRTRMIVDNDVWFDGPSSCVLVANIGTISGGIVVFDEARPDDGRLEIGVVTAKGFADWVRVFGRLVRGQPKQSPFVRTTSGERVEVRVDRPVVYQLDGGDRKPTKRLTIRVERAAVELCVPRAQNGAA